MPLSRHYIIVISYKLYDITDVSKDRYVRAFENSTALPHPSFTTRSILKLMYPNLYMVMEDRRIFFGDIIHAACNMQNDM